jgi:hypothetical protein
MPVCFFGNAPRVEKFQNPGRVIAVCFVLMVILNVRLHKKETVNVAE